jgi:hypothetical protein
VTRAVDVALEGDPVVVDLVDPGEREDLEAAGVGEDRPAPAHEAVEAADLAQHVEPGAEVEVVGVAEHDLHAGPRELLRVEGLHGAERPDRHEAGGVEPATGEREEAGPGPPIRPLEAEAHRLIGRSPGKTAHSTSVASP